MVLFQFDLTRIIQVYVVQGIICVYFLFLAYKILSHNKQHLNIILSCSYITVAIGFIINFIYAPLTIESIVLILYYLTILFLFLYSAFLLVFVLMLYESEKVFTISKGIVIIIIYAIILLCMVFIPNGVIINASTDWKPVWSWYLFFYVVSVTSIAFFMSFYVASKIYKEFTDEQLKKKWRFFLIGIAGLYIFAFGTLLSNTLNIQIIRTIWSLISLVLVVLSPYLMYYGVGKHIRE